MELSLIDAPVTLTTELIDIESPSRHEAKIADVIEAALRGLEAGAGNVSVQRFGNTIVARTHFAKAQRVVLAGHVDTVPLADNTPHHFEDTPEGRVLFGCGAVDMKSGLACYLSAFAALANDPEAAAFDLTFIAYELSLIHI